LLLGHHGAAQAAIELLGRDPPRLRRALLNRARLGGGLAALEVLGAVPVRQKRDRHTLSGE
jgi:hypothetical protein